MRVICFLFVALFFVACHKDKKDDGVDENHIVRVNYGSVSKVVKDVRSGFILAGGVKVFNSSQSQIIKIDSLGYRYWGSNYGDNDVDYTFDILRINTGYLTVGYSAAEMTHDTAFAIACLDYAGSVFWQRKYSNGVARVIIDAVDNNYYGEYVVGGEMKLLDEEANTSNNKIVVLKVNNKGTKLWQYAYTKKSDISDIARSNDGFFVAGNTFDVNNVSKVLVVRLNANGQEEWVKDIQLKDIKESVSVSSGKLLKITDGFLLTVNTSTNSEKISKDAYLLKITPSGEVVWQRSLANNFEISDAKIFNGKLYLLGNCYNSAIGHYETGFIDADVNGTVNGQYNFVINNDDADDNSTSMYLDNDFIYIVGNSELYRGTSNNRMYYFKHPLNEIQKLVNR